MSPTCVPAVCKPQPHSGRSSRSRKYFPSRHGDRPPLAPPSCCRRRRRPPGAPEDLTGQKATFPFMRVFGHSSQRPVTVLGDRRDASIVHAGQAGSETGDVGGPAYLWQVRWRAPRLSPGWIVPCSGRPRPRRGSSRSGPRCRDDSPAGTSPSPRSGRRPAGSGRRPRQRSRPAPLQRDPWTRTKVFTVPA